MIGGQRVSVIRSILQKMLNQSQCEDKSQWTDEEMFALTDIFKNLVHKELSPDEGKVEKVQALERQNEVLSR